MRTEAEEMQAARVEAGSSGSSTDEHAAHSRR